MATVTDNDAHVVPDDQEHDTSPNCWCQPMSDYQDAVTGGRIWLHRRAHDLPHREPNPRLLGGDDSNEPAGPPPEDGE